MGRKLERSAVLRSVLLLTSVDKTHRIKGAFFWDYSVVSYSGIRITEHTEYQFPKEQSLCYSENRVADVTKMEAMRPRKSGYAIFPPKDERKFPMSIPSILLSGAELTEYYSVHSGIRIGPKRTQLPPILCILIRE